MVLHPPLSKSITLNTSSSPSVVRVLLYVIPFYLLANKHWCASVHTLQITFITPLLKFICLLFVPHLLTMDFLTHSPTVFSYSGSKEGLNNIRVPIPLSVNPWLQTFWLLCTSPWTPLPPTMSCCGWLVPWASLGCSELVSLQWMVLSTLQCIWQ